MNRAKATAAQPLKRGKSATLPDIEVVGAAHKAATEGNRRLSTIGITRLVLPAT